MLHRGVKTATVNRSGDKSLQLLEVRESAVSRRLPGDAPIALHVLVFCFVLSHTVRRPQGGWQVKPLAFEVLW